MIDAFYTVKEFAKIMKTDPQMVRKGIRSGRIQALKLTGGKNATYRIPVSEIDRLLLITYDEQLRNINSINIKDKNEHNN